jgi:hypothetical protein
MTRRCHPRPRCASLAAPPSSAGRRKMQSASSNLGRGMAGASVRLCLLHAQVLERALDLPDGIEPPEHRAWSTYVMAVILCRRPAPADASRAVTQGVGRDSLPEDNGIRHLPPCPLHRACRDRSALRAREEQTVATNNKRGSRRQQSCGTESRTTAGEFPNAHYSNRAVSHRSARRSRRALK